MPEHPVRDAIRLMEPAFYVDRPFEHWAWMREHAPVYFDEAGGVWGVTRHEDVSRLSKTPELFCSGKSSRPERGSWLPSMINLDAPEHRRRRGLVNRGFTPRRVADHEPKIRRICHALVDAVAERGRCDFVHEIAAPLPMILIGDMLGVEPEDRDRLLRWSDELLGAGLPADASAEERRAQSQKAGLEYVQWVLGTIADRRAHPRDDLISILVHADIDGDRLTDEELIHESLLILVGGDETTRHVISGGMHALIQHPDQRELLQREPQRIPLAVEEMLRWVTPIQNMNRTTTRDLEYGGQKIREGDRVLLLYPSANRDERVFDAPERFDVGRTPNEHVAFGGYGPHFCLGASLARLELRVMFEVLLERLPDLELVAGAACPLRPSNFIVGFESMPVVFPPRAPRAVEPSP
jgi:cytochrome P450 family 142 subfamily A polypeptide 1